MRRYAAILIHAHSKISGRTLEEVTRDMHLEGIVDPDQIRNLSKTEEAYLQEILKDGEKVLSLQAGI